jgi:uncharacterized BrkB/YihY/UPF0761 family membrane protein
MDSSPGGAPERDTAASRREAYRLAAARGRHRAEEIAPRVPGYDYAATLAVTDQRRAGAVLAGALAYRVFLFLVPVMLALHVTLGQVVDQTTRSPEELAEDVGLSAFAIDSVAEAGESASGGWVVGLLVVAFAVFLTGTSLIRAVASCHLLAWGMPLRRIRVAPLAVLAAVGVVVALLTITWTTSHLRADAGLPGVALALAMAFVAEAGIWWLVSSRLPHGDATLQALVPGALLVGVGGLGLHAFTSLYLVDRADRAADLYGPLGVATVLLLWLFVASRLVIASAVLNAVLWDSREAGR